MSRSRFGLWLALIVIGMLLACVACGSSNDDPTPTDGDTDTVVDGDEEEETADTETEAETPVITATTTAARTIVPDKIIDGSLCKTTAERKQAQCKNPALAVPGMDVYLNYGFGTWTFGLGEDYTLMETVGATRGTPTASRSLFRFVHLSDIHITDEEGAMRMGSYDTRGIDSALRPADMYSEIVLDAAVRTINGLNADAPWNFALFTGDMTDTSERFELANFFAVTNGGEVDPDSGDDDDPITGPGNDPQDVFTAEGLKIPFIVTLGNHDELVLGNTPISQTAKDASKGAEAETGTRNGQNYSLITGSIVADLEREMLTPAETIAFIADTTGNPAGHGLSQEAKTTKRAYYTYDPPSSSLVRVIVLASSARPQGYEGSAITFVAPVIDITQFNDFLKPELERAKTDKKLVIISTHGPTEDFEDDGLPERFVSADDFIATLTSYPNVILHCVGHQHYNRVWSHVNAEGTSGYFEVESPSLADWPKQFRGYEIVDNGNGTLSIFTVAIDYSAEKGSLADTARTLSLIDPQSSWYGVADDYLTPQRNLELIVKVPEGFADTIAAATAYPEAAAMNRWKHLP